MNAHTENKRLTCPTCLKQFGTEHACKTHMKRKKHLLHKWVLEPWAKYAAPPKEPTT